MIDPHPEDERKVIKTFSREGASGAGRTVAVPRPLFESQQ